MMVAMTRASALDALVRAVPDVSAVERVIVFIRNGIRDGRFAPGQRLIEGELQAALGVSRGSIREAIRRLAAEHILQVELHKGARVRQLSADEIRNIYQVREVLEGLASRLAAENARPADANLKALAALEKEFDRDFDGTAQAYLRYNERFHRLILQMAGNAELSRLIGNLEIPSFILLVHVLVSAESIERARAEHRPIVQAILKRDGGKAERAMRTHIRRTHDSVLKIAAESLYVR
jgi:DNA-binding GntR family transcriptional regulator